MRKNRFKRLNADIGFPNPAICFCSADPPDPDPMIGQAASQNAEVGKEMAGIARDQLQWNKDRAAVADPLTQKIAEQQIATSDTNTARSQDQWDTYQNLFKPVEAKMVDDANNWDSDARKDQMAAEAGADVTNSYQGAKASSQRQMESMGINPNSGRYAALNAESDLAQAKDTAGAMNKARRDTEQQGVALRTGVAQFGRNMPNTGIAADTVALNAGTAAGNTMATSANTYNAGSNTAANWFGGSTGATSAGGNLGLGLYSQQLGAWNQNQQNQASSMAGIGQAAGMAGAAAIMMRRGGLIGKPRAFKMHRPNFRGGLQALRYGRRFADGGMVESEPDAQGPDYGYGKRQDGTNKGLGWLGVQKSVNGHDMTEYTVGLDFDGKHIDVPAFVPGLTHEEVEHLKTEPDLSERSAINDSITAKAGAHAQKMMSQGKSVFAPPPPQKGYRAGGLVGSQKRMGYGYAAGGLVDPNAPQPGGGMVSGPGTSTSDSVPATVNGVQPARLSDGEAVLNAEAVALVGEDFVHRINSGGLAMAKNQPMETQS